MQIGDILTLVPTIYGTKCGLEELDPMPCRVVYIHPQHRFYTVQFTSRITGETWREAFYFPLAPNPPLERELPIGFHRLAKPGTKKERQKET